VKIKEIHIYGYGKMKDMSFTNLQSFQVFFGRNEAGKSTIMSFIHSILFGFPTKVQNENRYEPKEHPVYGGKLIILTEKDGEVSIQRIKGKASGDVTVTYSDGRVGFEEELHRLLQGLDKSTYQSIFSFDLSGLNELHKLSESEVSRYLLSAGLLGSDDLLRTEQQLQKELEANFKPAGKLPKLNSLLMEMQTSFESLSQAGKEQDLYEQHKEDYHQFLEKKEQLERRLEELQEKLASSRNYLAIEPLLLEEKRVQQKLDEMEEVLVSVDGEEQLQQMKQALLPIEASLQSLKMRKDQVKVRLDQLQIDDEMVANQDTVQRAVEKSARLESMLYELEALQQQYKQHEDTIQRLKDEMHIHLADEDILLLDHSSMKKERVLQLDDTYRKLQHDKEILDRKQEEAQSTLQGIKQRMSELKSRLLSDEERLTLEQQVDRFGNANQANMQLELLNQSIASLEMQIKKAETKEANSRKSINKLFMLFIAAMIVFTLMFSFMQQWLFAGVMLVAASIIFLVKGSYKPATIVNDLREQLQQLQQQRADLINRFGPVSKDEIKHATTLLDRDSECQHLLQNEVIKKAEHEALFYRTIDDFEKWEREMAAIQLAKDQVLLDWRLNDYHISITMLPILYDTISSLKSYLYEKRHLTQRMEALQSQITTIESALISYCKKYANTETDSYMEAAMLVKRCLEDTNKSMLQKEEWSEAIRNFDEEIVELQLQYNHFQKQLQTLFESAACENEMDFSRKLQLAKEKKAYNEKLEIIKLQLAPYEDELVNWNQNQAVINSYTVSALEEEKQMCEKQLTNLEEQLADRRYRIQQLEEAGTFDERSFQYYTKKSELDEQAKDWMTLSLAKNMLTKVVNSYKNDKFPEILRNAEKLVHAITNGEYVGLYWKEEEAGLMLQRKDGVVFEAKEVSRGTQEGIYVALRLSLAGQVFSHNRMPIIIDDGFVNFDRSRVESVLKVLQSMQDQQIIFFTCHDYLLPYFQEEQIIQLSDYSLLYKESGKRYNGM